MSGEGAGGEGDSGDGGDGNFVNGRVVDYNTKRALAGRTVVLGASLNNGAEVMATTDEHGEFTLERPLAVYDAAVIEPNGIAISVYVGLGASELVLPHRSAGVVPTEQLAKVSGNVSGGSSYPLTDHRDVVAVYLFNGEAATRYLMGAGAAPYGPDYVTLAHFDAPGAIPHTLVALGTFGRKDGAPASDPAYGALALTRELTLADGDEVGLDLEIEPLDLGEISGVVNAPNGHGLSSLRTHYRFPYPEAIVPFPAADYVRQNPLTDDGAFVFELPELTKSGAVLCLAAVSEEGGALWTERCGFGLDEDPVSLELQAPPSLEQPSARGVVDNRTLFAWTRFDGGVHRLELWPDELSAATPGISVFTAAAETVVPDLSSLGVNLPNATPYRVTITGVGPAASLDEALKPNGPFAVIAAEWRVSSSATIDVTTTP